MIFKVNKNKKDVIHFLSTVGKYLDVDKSKIAHLKLVLEELLTNSIKHSDNSLIPIEIKITTSESDLHIEYHDYSEIFDIYEHYLNNNNLDTRLSEMQEGGFGIFLIFNIIKNYEFFYDQKQFKNTMKFNL